MSKSDNPESQDKQKVKVEDLAGLLGAGGGLGAMMGGGAEGGMPDISGLLSNPALMNMAQTLMSDPNMQNMMSNLLGGAGGPPGAPGAAPAPAGTLAPNVTNEVPLDGGAPPTDGITGLMQAGRQLAEQMQNQHPELLDQLRNQFGGPNGPNPPQGPPQ